MAGRAPETGNTAETVRENVQRLRGNQNLTWTQLSERLEALKWKLTPVALRNIEEGRRRVGVDDLTALAVALGVSPVTLLMPNSSHDDCSVEVTGMSEPWEVQHVWAWLTAAQPLPGTTSLLDFWASALPDWLRRRMWDAFEKNKRVLPPSAFLLEPTTSEINGDDK